MKKLNKLFLLFLLPLIATSCLVDDTAETGLDTSPYIVGFAKKSGLESHFSDVGAVDAPIGVNLLGGQSGKPLTSDLIVTVEIDPSSTAVEGQEFSLLSNTFAIPAGTTFGQIPLQVNTGNLDPNQPTFVILKLTNVVGGGVASALADTYKLTFVGCQSDHAGAYTCPEISAAGAPNTTITELAPNTYRIEAMPFLAFGGAGGAPAWMDFTNICGDITVTGWVGGSLIDCTGTVDANGVISFGDMTIYNGHSPSTGVWFDLGPSTYTPN